jgi:beta-barrel assembly-enhancing protease
MMFKNLFITVVCIAGLFSSVYAQTLKSAEELAKKGLSTVEQKAGPTVDKIKQAAQQAVKADNGIPLVGDLSDADEQALGRETAGRLLAANPLVKNDSVQRYVNFVGMYVAHQSSRPGLAWTFGVIESDDINAFAMPGGYIVLTSGMYKTLQNEAELAAVLGHEIAHVNLRHHVRLMQKERLIAQGRDFLVGKTKVDALKALAGPGAEICARSLDKNAEFESDRIGLEYAARAGYDPFAYLDVLDRMGVSNQSDRLSLLYKTHPHPRDRLAALEKAIASSWTRVAGIVPKRWVALQ